jgi:hypothetical protein
MKQSTIKSEKSLRPKFRHFIYLAYLKMDYIHKCIASHRTRIKVVPLLPPILLSNIHHGLTFCHKRKQQSTEGNNATTVIVILIHVEGLADASIRIAQEHQW